MLSASEAIFVAKQRVARFATASRDGAPHAIPICFVYRGGLFYSAIDEKPKSGAKLRRLRNIEENRQAAMIFDSYDEDWTKLAWVLVRGQASMLYAGSERDDAVAALREKYHQYSAMDFGGKPVIRVQPEQVSSWAHSPFRDH